MAREYFVYIMTNKGNNVLYTGATGNIVRRVEEHQNGVSGGFSSKYNTRKLVYLESYPTWHDARLREKQIKGGSRKKKIALIQTINPNWQDLSKELFSY